jgi:hypothetical protein
LTCTWSDPSPQAHKRRTAARRWLTLSALPLRQPRERRGQRAADLPLRHALAPTGGDERGDNTAAALEEEGAQEALELLKDGQHLWWI